jgi:hypothetical protein
MCRGLFAECIELSVDGRFLDGGLLSICWLCMQSSEMEERVVLTSGVLWMRSGKVPSTLVHQYGSHSTTSMAEDRILLLVLREDCDECRFDVASTRRSTGA